MRRPRAIEPDPHRPQPHHRAPAGLPPAVRVAGVRCPRPEPRRRSCSRCSAPPTGSTASWPAGSTRCRRRQGPRPAGRPPARRHGGDRRSSSHGAVPVWFGVATLGREVLVSAIVLVLAALGRRADRRAVGGQGGHLRPDVRLPGLPARPRHGAVAGAIRDFAWVAGDVGLTLAWIAAAAYVRPARQAALAAGRRGRRAADAERSGRSRREGGDHGGRRGHPAAAAHLQPAQADAARWPTGR